MKHVIFIPLIIAVLALAVVFGVGLYVTDFTAYLGSNPATCNNCHVMDAVYEGWYHSSHHEWATCTDCHTPHALIPKYIVKAESGYHHVTAFAFEKIPNAIRAKESSNKTVHENCIRCHAETVDDILGASMAFDRNCFDCHREVSHGERGVSILPFQDQEKYR